MSISLTHVKKSYVIDNQAHRVINIPEFKVENGGKMAIVGRSGSGKSTLLNLISGILLPDDGQITIKDTDLNRLSEPERDLFRARTIGFVFQTFNLLQGLTAEENVALAMSFAGKHGQALHQAKTLLDKVGLGNKSHHKPRQLSVGEQQRVALARAISNNPHIILADEPTANLDEQSAEIVMDLLMELSQAEDRILLVVSHEKEIAQKLPEQLLLSTLNQVQHT